MANRFWLPFLFLCGVSVCQPTVVVPGYSVNLFHQEAQGLRPTSMTVDDAGRLYLLTLDGRIQVLQDLNQDGVAETITLFWDGTAIVSSPALGLLWFQGAVYVSHLGVITRVEDTNGDLVADTAADVVTGLPFGWHSNNDLFTDGTFIYFGLGSISDHDVDPDPRSGTLMRMSPNGSGLQAIAYGLRNTFDAVVHPVSGEIFGGDNGPNLVSNNPHPDDELNRIIPGQSYGHPWHWGALPAGASGTGPVLVLPPHLAPCGITVNRNRGLSGHRNELILAAFVNVWGSVLRIPLHYGVITGEPGVWAETLCSGFQTPIDVEFTPDGTLFVADYGAGGVYRIVQDSSPTLVIETQPSIGMTCQVTLSAPDYPNAHAWAAVSTGLAPPLPVGGGYTLDLDTTSPLWLFSMTPGNGIFSLPAPGLLDGQGRATAQIAIPFDPALVGLSVEMQYLVLNGAPATVVAVSPPVRILVLPRF